MVGERERGGKVRALYAMLAKRNGKGRERRGSE